MKDILGKVLQGRACVAAQEVAFPNPFPENLITKDTIYTSVSAGL